jgi:homoserine dehydrogenase
VPVITCEKGALSNYYAELEGAVRSHRIGYSASVGGGSGLLGYLQERMGPGVREVHAIVNGTLNYILEGLSRGRNLDEVVEETKILGYAEPRAKHPLEVFNKEGAGDVPMKASIQVNLSNLTKDKMRAKDVKVQMIGPDQLERLVKEAASRRYVVSITRDANDEEDVIWGFRHRIENWHISGGFRRIEDNPLLRELVPSGVNNAILVSEGFGRHDPPLWGPGAGAGPTAGAMMIDAERILGI